MVLDPLLIPPGGHHREAHRALHRHDRSAGWSSDYSDLHALMASGKKTLVVEPGTYTLTTTLTIPEGVSVYWRGAEVIQSFAGKGMVLAGNDISLYDLVLRGRHAGATVGIEMINRQYCLLQNCKLYGFTDGILSWTDAGIKLVSQDGANCAHNTLINIRVHQVGGDAQKKGGALKVIGGCSTLVVLGGNFSATQKGAGFYAEDGPAQAQHVEAQFMGTTFEGSEDHNFFCQRAYGLALIGVHFENAAAHTKTPVVFGPAGAAISTYMVGCNINSGSAQYCVDLNSAGENEFTLERNTFSGSGARPDAAVLVKTNLHSAIRGNRCYWQGSALGFPVVAFAANHRCNNLEVVHGGVYRRISTGSAPAPDEASGMHDGTPIG